MKRFGYPVVVEETWTEHVGGIISSSRNPSPGDKRHTGFENVLRKKFDSLVVDGLITVRYTTELAVG